MKKNKRKPKPLQVKVPLNGLALDAIKRIVSLYPVSYGSSINEITNNAVALLALQAMARKKYEDEQAKTTSDNNSPISDNGSTSADSEGNISAEDNQGPESK